MPSDQMSVFTCKGWCMINSGDIYNGVPATAREVSVRLAAPGAIGSASTCKEFTGLCPVRFMFMLVAAEMVKYEVT